MQKLLYNFLIAVESIEGSKVRSLLTMLGMIFGVASVIAMLAVGKGAEQEILQQIRLLGANNIIVKPVIEQSEGLAGEGEEPKSERNPWSPGLSVADAVAISTVIPGVKAVSPEVVIETHAIREGLRRSARLIGVGKDYFDHPDYQLAQGRFFSDRHLERAAPVALIGNRVKTRFFTKEDALGSRIKCGRLWLTVVGVFKERSVSERSMESLGIRDYNYDIYTPIKTVLLRYEDRARVTITEVQSANSPRRGASPHKAKAENYHQLDQLTVRVSSSEMVHSVSDVINRMLKRRHNGVVDFELIIPEQLLQQERRTQSIFNMVLTAIASISLVVGGIGIMNIMLASVLERTREIGIRRSVGATQRDVALQFLIEAITISFIGGMLGIGLGFLISFGIEKSTGIQTIVSLFSVGLAFLISVSVGLAFGLLPAKRAAGFHPVEALRYE